MVLVDNDTWFADDGMLSKVFCEFGKRPNDEEHVEENYKECCTCDEAKYTVLRL